LAKQLFGTDGIRGTAGTPPLDPQTVFAFGLALGEILRARDPHPEVLLGMDTRESSPWIAAAVAGGLARAGVTARSAGLLTTPGVAHLTRTLPFAAGVMISASHNPFEDNGIKVFDHSGFKLPDDQEYEIEEEIFRLRARDVVPVPRELPVDEGLDAQYLAFLLSTLESPPPVFTGRRVVLDCGYGAASRLAPELFRRAGAEVMVLHDLPDGRNINLACGATHPEPMRRAVVDSGADFGVAFDGDADRAILAARSGRVIDGDAVLLIAARHLKSRGRLRDNLVVATVMSNLGLEKALEREGIRLLRTAVGDKYVLEEMVRAGAAVGGEQSGHVIFRDYATTGDGLLTALRIAEIMTQTGKSLDELAADLRVYPQRLLNVRVRERKTLAEIPGVREEIRAGEELLAGAGRIFVRFSGTEPLARVMVEAENESHVELVATRIAQAIQREIGA
jgi:phosphoglucosamine mutase